METTDPLKKEHRVTRGKRRCALGVVVLAMLLGLSLAHAQVTTTGDIHGKVLDPSGAVIPNAEVKLTDQLTGAEKSTTSAEDGGFVFVGLQPGSYRVTAKVTGFQTAVYADVRVQTARVTDLVVKLAIGQVTETVTVSAEAQALETSSTQVANTVQNVMIQDLPLSGRDVLSFGLLTAGAQRGASDRSSTYNGLPNASLNITLDGINDNSQRFKSGGTSNFVFAPLRLGAIEEVTVASAGLGSDSSGEGGMQMRFVTKRGTNDWHGSVFEQLRNDALNANNWVNNARGIARPKLRQNEFGGNLGGPLWKNKLFFFVNFEELRIPSANPSSNTVLTAEAQQGIFRYVGSDGQQHTANLLQIAGANGFPSQLDTTMSSILKRMNDAQSSGVVTANNLFTNQLRWNQPGGTTEHYPTARLDYQVTPRLSWTGTWNLRWRDIDGTQPWPGPGFKTQSEFKSTYYIASTGVSWAPTTNIVNEAKFGVQSNVEEFFVGEDLHQFNVNGTLERLNFPFGIPDLVRPNITATPRNNPVYNVYDNLSWNLRNHTFTFGGSVLHTSMWESSFNDLGVLNTFIGTDPADPITSVLSPNNLPGIQSADLQNAWDLYSTLTGRISGIFSTRDVNPATKQYQDFIPLVEREAQTNFGLYFQDSWRMRPGLTMNYGLRWEFAGDDHNTNGVYTSPDPANLMGPSTRPFAPGVLDGVLNPQIQLRPHTYNRDYVNPAPNLGFAWNPDGGPGFLGKVLGQGRKTVIRASFGIDYYQEGLLDFQVYAAGNPGLTQDLFLTPGMAGFNPGSLSLSQKFPPLATFPASFSPPFPQSDYTFSGTTLSSMQENLRTPYVSNWTFGIQREFAPNTVVEVRYVGNKGTHIWHAYNLNETNIFENGFLTDFQNAQRNLAVNQAAGVTSFANRGLPGQVALPIFQAAFGALGSQAALGNSSGFANGTFINDLRQGQAGALANSLAGSSIYLCRMVGAALPACSDLGFNAAGAFPINIFQPNPYAAGAGLSLVTDGSYSTYNALQIEVRRAMAHGLMIRSNYTLSHSLGDMFAESDISYLDYTTIRDRSLNKAPSVFDIRHAWLTYFNYELPFGAGHSIHGEKIVNGFIGGWGLSSIIRIQSGRPFKLTSGRDTFNQNDSGVILNGVTASQLQDMIQVSPGPNANISFVSSQLVGPDRRASTSLLTSPTTPGQLGQLVYLYGPGYFQWDMALLKDIAIWEKVKMTFQLEALNVFNHPVFQVSGSEGPNVNINSTSFGQTTSQVVGARNLQARLQIRF